MSDFMIVCCKVCDNIETLRVKCTREESNAVLKKEAMLI
jgi:hypothetical protein